jgi:putative Holliday junction resolvase
MAVNLLGIDVGEKRVGVARVSLPARLPEALVTLKNDESFIDNIKKIVSEYQIDTLIVGLPRNLNGQETTQSATVRHFCQVFLKPLGLPIIWQDETLSSRLAEDHMKGQNYKKPDIDRYAAAIILEDYLLSSKI